MIKESFIEYAMQSFRYFKKVPKRAEHGTWPIFSTELGSIAHILANVGNRTTGGHKNI